MFCVCLLKMKELLPLVIALGGLAISAVAFATARPRSSVVFGIPIVMGLGLNVAASLFLNRKHNRYDG